jgi:hypothetical protein
MDDIHFSLFASLLQEKNCYCIRLIYRLYSLVSFHLSLFGSLLQEKNFCCIRLFCRLYSLVAYSRMHQERENGVKGARQRPIVFGCYAFWWIVASSWTTSPTTISAVEYLWSSLLADYSFMECCSPLGPGAINRTHSDKVLE